MVEFEKTIMFPKNDNIGEINIIQNQFTAYLVTAVRRRRKGYLESKAKQERYEIPLTAGESRRDAPCERVMINHLHLQCVLEKLKKRELRILTMKVLKGYMLQEIADELNANCDAIRSTYYRTLKRLKGELEDK